MPTMTLPPVSPAPIPTQLVAPPAAGAGALGASNSFSQMLEAADARRQAEAPQDEAASSPESKTQNATTGPRPQAPVCKVPARETTKTERTKGQAETEGHTAECPAADAAATAGTHTADEATAPADAASLLASLGLMNRPNPALVPAEGGGARGRGGASLRALGSAIDAQQARTGAGADASGASHAAGALAADLQATEAAADRSTAGKAFAGLLAAAQGAPGDPASAGNAAAVLVLADQPLAPPAEARPADASALSALLGAGAAPAAVSTGSSATHPAEARLSTPPGQAGFAEQLGAQLSTFVRDGVQHARLQLHPLELGPVTVQIQLDGGSAHLSFAAEHAQTRQALEQALPTLASSLREAGLTLSGGGVFEQPRQPQPEGDGSRGNGPGARGGRSGGDTGNDGSPLQGASSPALRRRGVVDLVA